MLKERQRYHVQDSPGDMDATSQDGDWAEAARRPTVIPGPAEPSAATSKDVVFVQRAPFTP